MPETKSHYAQLLDSEGFAVVPRFVDSTDVVGLAESVRNLMTGDPAPGMRDLATKLSAVRQLAESAGVRDLLYPILGPQARLVRSVLFVKTARTNWGVSWHQDLSIAVRRQVDVPGFSAWSVKAGITHVQPPQSVLEQMVALRIHLDPADASNGALMVSPGSHRRGRIPVGQAAELATQFGSHICEADAGDAVLMRPLILHASSKSKSPAPRRIIHLEFAGVELPASLEWNEAA